MATEIERKFLVKGDGWRAAAGPPRRLAQAYLCGGAGTTVRVRIVDDARGYLTVKGRTLELAGGVAGSARAEFEYEIPLADAEAMLQLRTGALLAKSRHVVPEEGGLAFEIDVFEADYAGLVVAEIELPAPDAPFTRPDWLGDEVTGDPRYFNAAMAAGEGPRRS